ncbi:MAG: putative transrane permease protein [Alphaproteobacteria bacterium]|nr:putative transrane permease protein [Alphaproteobacteria bacterium]
MIGGATTLMVAMGIGRFLYTPILPDMIADGLLDVPSAGLLASSNFLGYFVGALGAAFFGNPRTRRALLIAAIVVSVLTTLAMGLTQHELTWHALRFISGVASAVALVFMTGFVMENFAAASRAGWIGWVYGGVGIGIVLSSIVIEVLQKQGVAWDWQWLAGGMLAALLALPALYAAIANQPAPPAAPRAADAPKRARLFTLPLVLVLISYGGLGLGYVVQATYLPTLVRTLPALAEFSTLAWLIVGLAAAPSNVFWQFAANRMGLLPALILAYLIQAGGLLVPVLWHTVPGTVIGAAALGATLVGITALGLQQARLLAGDQAPRALALMTASFGLGQVIGPLLGALLVGPNNDFLPPTIMASSVLALSAVMLVPLLRKR